jgi:lipopolysaccharide export system protein LptC
MDASSASALTPLAGADRGRTQQRQPFVWRLQSWLGQYLPVAVMALLAAGTGWLVKQSPTPEGPTVAVAPRHKPDYEMQGFELQRFDAKGQPQAWVRGEELRHYPDTDRIEIDGVHLRARNTAGQWLVVQADKAEGPRDGSVLNLSGQVRLMRLLPGTEPGDERAELSLETAAMEVRIDERTARSSAATQAQTGQGARMQVRGFDYDHAKGLLRFGGPSRTDLPPKNLRP